MTSAITTTTTNPISSSSSTSSASTPANSKKSSTYTAAIYSFIAAISVLVFGALLKDGILMLPVALIGTMAIACTGQVILDVKRHPPSSFF